MKEWPPSPELVLFEELITPVRQVVDQGYKLVRKKRAKLTYDGYNIGNTELVGTTNPAESLSPEGFTYDEEQGRDLMDVILRIAFQLGVEQGRRHQTQKTGTTKELWDAINAKLGSQPRAQGKL